MSQLSLLLFWPAILAPGSSPGLMLGQKWIRSVHDRTLNATAEEAGFRIQLMIAPWEAIDCTLKIW